MHDGVFGPRFFMAKFGALPYERAMNSVLYVAMGGAIGASARHLLGHASLRVFGPGWPIGTFAANILGGLLMGLLIGYLATRNISGEALRLFAGVGVLGGFTTFSAFSLESYMMFEKKAYGSLIGYVGGSVILSILAIGLGLWLARAMFAS